MSSTVVRGLTMQNLSTTSPCQVVGTTNDRPRGQLGVAPRLILLGRPSDATEQHDRQFGFHQQFGVGAVVDQAGGHPSGGERGLDRLGVGVGAVRGEAEPQRQASRPTREVVGVVARVPRFVGRVGGVEHVEVLGVLRVRPTGDRRIAVQQRARVERREEPLVWIDDEAVGAFDPVETSADTRRGERCAAVRAVDVEPRGERRATSAAPCRSSITPTFVVPDVATTAKTRSRSTVIERGDHARSALRRPCDLVRPRGPRSRRHPSLEPLGRSTSGRPPTR